MADVPRGRERPKMLCPRCGAVGEVRDPDSPEPTWHRCDLCEGEGRAVCGHVFNAIGDDGTLVFKFPTREAALGFKSYMCDGGGESGFLDPQDELVAQGDLDEKDQVSRFKYHTGDNTIVVE